MNSHNRKSKYLRLGMILASTACSAPDPDDQNLIGESEEPITSGVAVVNNVAPFNSVVHLNGCSGVKVGSRRFLTAGHCTGVVDVGPIFNGRVFVTNALDGGGFSTVGVKRFYHHPSYTAGGSDIAVLDVLSDTPSIPALPIDSTTYPSQVLGRFMGYGCDEANPANTGRKQAGDALSLSLAQYEALVPGNGQNTYNLYTIFNGGTTGPWACFGDSGGPLFRLNSATWQVAGVNALRGLTTSGQRLSFMTRTANVRSWALSSTPSINQRAGFVINQLIDKCLTADTPPSVSLTECGAQSTSFHNQYWSREPINGTFGWWHLKSGKTGLCLDANGGSVTQRPCSPGPTGQQWDVSTTNGWIRITNRLGGDLGAVTGYTVHTSGPEFKNRQIWQVVR